VIGTNKCNFSKKIFKKLKLGEANCPVAKPYKHDVDRICYDTCPTTYFANTITGKCSDPCPGGTYPDAITKKCLICHYSCYTCGGGLETDCNSCYPHATKLANGKCQCDLTFYASPVNSCATPQNCLTCESCSLGCEVCASNSPNDCSSCITNYFLSNSNTVKIKIF
jgi:hypothetical protein